MCFVVYLFQVSATGVCNEEKNNEKKKKKTEKNMTWYIASTRTPKNESITFYLHCLFCVTHIILKIISIQICTSNLFSIKNVFILFLFHIIFYTSYFISAIKFFQCHISIEQKIVTIHTHT